MKQLTKSFKTVLQDLLYDPQLVNDIKRANLSREHLYNHLIRGNITLEEYVRALN